METSNISGVSGIIGRSITDNMNYLLMSVNQTRIIDMATPLYKVGEEVILKSVNRPECNGEYIVEAIIPSGGIYTSRNDNVILRNGSDRCSYLLDKAIFAKHIGKGEICWDESALRKKYPPSEFTFEELMNSLNLEMVK